MLAKDPDPTADPDLKLSRCVSWPSWSLNLLSKYHFTLSMSPQHTKSRSLLLLVPFNLLTPLSSQVTFICIMLFTMQIVSLSTLLVPPSPKSPLLLLFPHKSPFSPSLPLGETLL